MDERRSRWLGRVLTTLGVVLTATWLAVTLESRAFQASLSRQLDALRGSGSTPAFAAAARREARASGLIGRIEIPRLSLSAMVVEGTSGRALRHGVGHVEHTAFPGEPGNVALAAHRDTYFRDLRDVTMGDLIRVTTPDGSYAYRVDSILVVDPDRGDLLEDTGGSNLTLVTCYPFYWVGPAPRRFV